MIPGWVLSTRRVEALKFGTNLELVAEQDFPLTQGWGFARDEKRDRYLATELTMAGARFKTLCFLDCYWVGSLDFNFLVEIQLGFPLNLQKVKNSLQGGQQQPRFEARITRLVKPEIRGEPHIYPYSVTNSSWTDAGGDLGDTLVMVSVALSNLAFLLVSHVVFYKPCPFWLPLWKL